MIYWQLTHLFPFFFARYLKIINKFLQNAVVQAIVLVNSLEKFFSVEAFIKIHLYIISKDLKPIDWIQADHSG